MIGTTFSHYRILAELGRGGMGVVYKAQDLVLERPVALKVMRTDLLGEAAHRARFLQEARSAASLSHPNIATIYEANEVDGTMFIAMEFIEGESLRTLLEAPLPHDRALRIAIDVAAGLAHAHEQRVVHRDLKPENVLIARDGTAKILDFGLAKVLAEQTRHGNETLAGATATALGGLTQHGQIMGTPAYMSPEQARGLEVDFRTDQFAFGVLAYELLTGEAPFSGPTTMDTLSAVLNSEPVPLNKRDASLPPRLDRLVARCLSKEPQGRWATTQELVAELRRIELNPLSATSLALWKMRRFMRRPVVPVAAGVLALGAALAWWQPWHRHAGKAVRAATGATPERPNFILVADFQGAGVKPELLTATRELVLASLAQSTLVTPFSRAQLQRALKQAQKPDSTRITGEVAAELAQRGTARAYVEGRIDRISNRYSVVLDVVLADPPRSTLVTLNRVANSEDELISTLDKLGRELRQELGEQSDALRATTSLREAITPSFDAFSNYLRAIDLQRETKYAGSNQALRQALSFDPDFAAARQQMAINYYNQSFLDSAQAAAKLALQKPERLTDADRLTLQWFQEYALRYDLDAALQVSDAIMKQPKGPADRYGNRAVIFFDLGRYEDALEAHQHIDDPSLSPFGVSILQLGNRVHMLLQLGRLSEARATARKMAGTSQLLTELEIAVCGGQWSRADSLAAAVQASTASKGQKYQATLAQCALAARRGRFDAAAKGLQDAAAQAPNPFFAALTQVARLQLGVATGHVPDAAQLGVASDTTVAGWIVRGMAAAAHGDSTEARRCRAAVATGPGPEQRRYAADATVLDGWIAAATGRPAEVVRLLDGARTSGRGPWVTGRVPSRWLVAQALEHAGRLPEAIAAWDSVRSPRRLHQDVWTWFAFVEPLAVREMAKAEARSGQSAAAHTHLEALTALWPSPDGTGAALLADARRALAAGATPP